MATLKPMRPNCCVKQAEINRKYFLPMFGGAAALNKLEGSGVFMPGPSNLILTFPLGLTK